MVVGQLPDFLNKVLVKSQERLRNERFFLNFKLKIQKKLFQENQHFFEII